MFLAAAITTLGKTVLLVVAITFILWSLYTAMMIPKKRPGFPKRLDVFIVLSALLFVAQMAAVVWVTGTQAIEHEETSKGGHDTGSELTPTEPTPTETEPAAGGSGGGEGDAAVGEEVFGSAGCGSCHTLAAAAAAGSVGPNLDETKPATELIIDRVTNGQGGMPAFGDQLSEDEIKGIAAFITASAGG